MDGPLFTIELSNHPEELRIMTLRAVQAAVVDNMLAQMAVMGPIERPAFGFIPGELVYKTREVSNEHSRPDGGVGSSSSQNPESIEGN